MSGDFPPSHTRNLCLYRRLDNGVHEFTMTVVSREAVDEFIALLEALANSLPPGKTVPILFDSSVGTQPVSYIFSQALTMLRRVPSPTQNSRMAILFKPTVLINTIEVMLRMIPFVRVRFFKPDERDQALAWLTETAADRSI